MIILILAMVGLMIAVVVLVIELVDARMARARRNALSKGRADEGKPKQNQNGPNAL